MFISALLSLTLAFATPVGLAAPPKADATIAADCAEVPACPCCGGPSCPCAGEAPQRAPEAPVVPRPSSDIRVDIGPVPARLIEWMAAPITEIVTTPVSRSTATRDGVRLQASLCIWRT
ncbi:MAG: hypothetical protein ACREJD_17845 [Phycisphaerales bacterium]